MVRLPPDELSEWRLVGVPEAAGFLSPARASRLLASLAARDPGTVHLDHGLPP